MNKLYIGPSGNSESFYTSGYSNSIEAPKWLSEIGLNAYEYSLGRGFSLSINTAKLIGKEALKYDIMCSVHAPYYINFANPDELMGVKSFGYLAKSLEYLKALNGKHCVFHAGSCGKQSRDDALKLVYIRISEAIEQLYKLGNNDVYICPETMGKFPQIGTWKEIIDLCKIDKMLKPCFDFGHINAIEGGTLTTVDSYKRIFDYAFKILDIDIVKNCHIHFSKIFFGEKGEIKHLNFDDQLKSPDFESLSKVIKEYKLTPHILCESASNMSDDALIMKKILKNI